MSNKVSAYYPQYSLDGKHQAKRTLIFKHNGIFFRWKVPFFGPTQTQREAMDWAYGRTLPPVILVRHESPASVKNKCFVDPYEPHRTYYPYAVSVAVIHCVGEENPRTLNVYFCNIELHEHGADRHVDTRHQGVYVEEIK